MVGSGFGAGLQGLGFKAWHTANLSTWGLGVRLQESKVAADPRDADFSSRHHDPSQITKFRP